MEDFRKILDWCELKNIWFQGQEFTWSNCRDGSNLIQERLDGGVHSFEWGMLFSNSFIRHLNFNFSDHRPLLVEVLNVELMLDRGVIRGWRRFHFESCWVEREDCHRLVSQNWILSKKGIAMDRVSSAISNCLRNLSRWIKENRLEG